MMEHRDRLQFRRRSESGATLVEFALVAPVVFMLIFGLIAGCFLAYQNSAMHDGATAGARTGSIESPLVQGSCESGQPESIIASVSHAAPLLTVNPAPLCVQSNPDEMTENSPVNGDVNIVVDCFDSTGVPTACAGTPGSLAVSLTLSTKGLVAPIGLTYHLAASSQDPVLNFQ